jgi:hypothetical protein
MFGRKRKAAEKAAREAAGAAARVALLEDLLAQARTYEGVGGDEADDASPVPLKRDERLFLNVQGAALIEPRKTAGRWEGRSQGVSVPIPGLSGVRYRVGANRGTYVQGEEVPMPVDVGTFTITSTRAVFVGPKQTREWAWSKLLGVTHAVEAPWTAIAVSNRQKTSGVLYDNENADAIRFNIDLAVAIATDEREGLVKELEADLEEARSDARPQLPTS